MSRLSVARVTAGLAIAFVSIASTAVGQAIQSELDIRPNKATGDGITVNVVRVIQLGSTEAGTSYRYLISFSYRFSGRPSVFLPDGPGLAPSEGQFSYLTSDSQLTFFDSPGGRPPCRSTAPGDIHSGRDCSDHCAK